jgi:hypothetical protein
MFEYNLSKKLFEDTTTGVLYSIENVVDLLNYAMPKVLLLDALISEYFVGDYIADEVETVLGEAYAAE